MTGMTSWQEMCVACKVVDKSIWLKLLFSMGFLDSCEDLCRFSFLNKTTIYTWLLFSATIYILMELVNDLVNVRKYLELVINTCIFCSDKHNGVREQFSPLSHLLVNHTKLKVGYK